MSFATTTLKTNNTSKRMIATAKSTVDAHPAVEVEDIGSLTDALRMIATQQRRIRQLEGEALTDSLTGLLNSRGFHMALEREIEIARRNGGASAVLVLFDLDGLKQINDTHGHVVGDSAIRALADALHRRVRTTDYIARLGGDEFAVLLANGDPNRMQQRIVALAEHLNRELVRHGDIGLTLKVSHGAVTVTPGATPELLMTTADTALYRCKEARRIVAKYYN